MNEIYTEKEILGDALNTEKNATNLYNLGANEWVCEIKSVNRHSMISDGAVSSWNELATLVYITSI